MRAAAKILPDQVFKSATVIVFGRDGKKARGSWFPAESRAAAHLAAEAMGMNALDVANDDVRQLATKLPQGRVFDSGKAFVPFVQSAVLDALATHLPHGEAVKVRASGPALSAMASSGTPASGTGAVAPHYPKGWDDIKVGSLVLASESEEDGWWPCIVQEVYSKELRLRWRDFPDYDQITRGYDQVALMWAAPTQAAGT